MQRYLILLATMTLALSPAACSRGGDGTGENVDGTNSKDGDKSASGYWVDPEGNRHSYEEGEEPAVETAMLGLYSLTPAANCEEVTAQWQEAAIADMEKQLEENRLRLLNPGDCYWEDEYGYADCSAMGEVSASEDDEGASEYSTTNTQEVGVDEADFLKNDGSYIYMVVNGEFKIIDAWPAEEAHTVSSTAMPGTPKRLYVHKDIAVVYSSIGYGYGYYSECTYGYDCEFTGDGADLQITVLDISDRKKPVKLREISFSGSYLSSRRVEDFVHTVVYFDEPPMPAVKLVPDEFKEYLWDCYWEDETLPYDLTKVDAAFAKLAAENAAKIKEASVEEWLPKVTDTWYKDGKPSVQGSPLTDCSGYYLSQTGDGSSLLSVASFDLTEFSPMKASTIIAKPGAVYASKQSLYIATRHYRGWDYYGNGHTTWFEELPEGLNQATTLHKFLLAADSPTTGYVGSGVVKGRVLNQFAMSDHQGKLRIATTHGHVPDPDVHSTISILQPADGKLTVIGQLDNIAPTEDIRSVRFGTELGFVVTFKKTDPLFVIDLSDPTLPTIKGELKIPGFSTYMHFMDKEHLLTIGYDADDQGSFAWFQGIQLQVLDVTDITDPKLLHKEVIGTRGSTSDATSNHFAFNYFKPKDLLAVPMVVCEESSGGGSYGDEMTFNGLMVYNITVEDGFNYEGGIPHKMYEPYNDYWGSSCSNWWTQSNSTVKRSIIMDDYVFSVAMDTIKISRLIDLGSPVAEVPLD